jgi:Flp pilus assembly protein TadG
MAALRHRIGTRYRANKSGQAAVEFAIIVTTMLVLLLALIDLSRAVNSVQVMVGLSRQGSNLASRGTSLPNSVAAVVAGDAPLDLANHGKVIITSVTRTNNVNVITGQATLGGITGASRIGSVVGQTATVPASTANMLQAGQTIYVTEVFYSYQAITPLGALLHIVMPSTLYQAAYF